MTSKSNAVTSMQFHEIDRAMQSFEIPSATKPSFAVASVGELAAEVAGVYRAVRLLMVAVSAMPFPDSWREKLQHFTTKMDALTDAVSTTPDFKAGKDL